jgi:hypothetical protein
MSLYEQVKEVQMVEVAWTAKQMGENDLLSYKVRTPRTEALLDALYALEACETKLGEAWKLYAEKVWDGDRQYK